MVITLYSTQTCIWCHKVREFLRAQKVKFKDVDVGAYSKAAAAMIKKSGQQGVPVIDVNGTIIVGYDEQKLRTLLKIKK